MKHLLIRHASTDANRFNRATFGKLGAPINNFGIEQAKELGLKLTKLGIDSDEIVAISELLRTKQTATNAGLENLKVNTLLNEVNTTDPAKTLKLLEQGKLPVDALVAARAIIANPPIEKIWVTHGLVIAALLVELGLSDPDKFVPDFCEIREIEL